MGEQQVEAWCGESDGTDEGKCHLGVREGLFLHDQLLLQKIVEGLTTAPR